MGEPKDDSVQPSAPPSADPHAEEAQVASAMYLAGEALAAESRTEAARYAVPEGDISAPTLDDFAWLRELVSQMRRALADDPRRADLLRRLPSLLGDGEILQVLFGQLFPEQRHRRKEAVTKDGKKRLTETQIEILRHIAQGKTPAQIAIDRECSPANVNNILKSIGTRLNTQSPQESVAVAISMGHLPLDVMAFVRETSRCSPRDYSPLDWQIASHGLELLADAAQWQEVAAFGLLLMLATNTAAVPLGYAANPFPTSGVLYRLEPEVNGAYRARQVVGPGRLRSPTALVIVPPAARREGFVPGHVYVVHRQALREGLNQQEIVEFAPDGAGQRVLYGGRTMLTGLIDVHTLLFETSGALLATSGASLQRFTEGGGRVRPLIQECCTGVTVTKGRLYLAHFSTRGGSIGLYAPNGKWRQTFAPLPMDTFFSSIQSLPNGEIAALRRSPGPAKPEEPMMQIYDAGGSLLRCWRVPGASQGAFAFHARDHCLYIPCKEGRDIAVYTPDGKLQRHIPLPADISPHAVTFGSDSALWLIGSVLES